VVWGVTPSGLCPAVGGGVDGLLWAGGTFCANVTTLKARAIVSILTAELRTQVAPRRIGRTSMQLLDATLTEVAHSLFTRKSIRAVYGFCRRVLWFRDL
jgi:hypothetical protein